MNWYEDPNIMRARPISGGSGGEVASYPSSSPTGQKPAAQPAQSPAQASGNVAGQAPGGIQPTYLSSMFPNGTPQTQVQGSNVDADPNSFMSMISKSLQPEFGRQDRALQDSLANAGIVGGSTGGAFEDLGKQQQSTLQNDLSQSLLQSRGQEIGQSEFNAGAVNSADQFNTGNKINTGEFDVSNNLQAQQANAGYANQDWLARLNAQQNYDLAGQSGKNSAYTPIYTNPSQGSASTGGFASALQQYGSKPPSPAPSYSSVSDTNATGPVATATYQ